MYKIVAAINSMIEHSHLIERVLKGSNAYFFLYDNKFRWSISKNDPEEYYLIYYPGNQKLDEITEVDKRYFNEYVQYSTQEIRTKEAIESFSELYRTVQNKLYGIDDVLDEIIKTAA